MIKCVQMLLIFALISTANSQEVTQESYFEYSKNIIIKDAKHAFNMGLGFVQAPFHFNSNDWLIAAGVVSVTSGLFLVDPHIKTFALDNRSKFADKIFKIDDLLHSSSGIFLGTSLYLSGFIFKQDKIRTMGLHTIETLFIAGSITGFLKYTFGRRRPYTGDEQMDFKLFRGDEHKNRSFPSGHTTGAMAFASVMAMSIDNIYWKSAWYTSATLVAGARIYNNKHWLSDTFFAAAISYSVAHYVVNFGKKDKNNTVSISPTLNGISLSVSF